MEIYVKSRISDATQSGELCEKNWEAEPVPSLVKSKATSKRSMAIDIAPEDAKNPSKRRKLNVKNTEKPPTEADSPLSDCIEHLDDGIDIPSSSIDDDRKCVTATISKETRSNRERNNLWD